ncbi:DsrH/TusB family sulfur metabolism protein [Marinomonas ostreistagni]|uniref:Sulfurtransferase complex subunit TusB n=1 Tax=Marinomonas ostreistagni TaxID=359209 RepID=A0ABS0ZCB8_9GAMM|nr:DsrH/TusB family sulfur metabolism protein [Marinomonas ostreistagni]MBJ7551292.1 hypothetical protein [Marinomonas ostreistagni]
MKLYQINQSQYPQSVELDWTESLNEGDAAFLFEAGVLRLATQTSTLETLSKKKVSVYFRQQDLEAYGLSPSIGKSLSDIEWVGLTQQYSKIVSW